MQIYELLSATFLGLEMCECLQENYKYQVLEIIKVAKMAQNTNLILQVIDNTTHEFKCKSSEEVEVCS